MFFYGPLHMDMPVLSEQQEVIYISSVQTWDVVWKTCRKRWMIGTNSPRERGVGKSVQSTQLGDDDDDDDDDDLKPYYFSKKNDFLCH